ncbi:MAG: hypothetical protein AB8B61_00360 [Cyclobacteriaceae bacterium]
MNSYPIIFLHKGNPEYLRIALDRLILSNGDAKIILLGDESNKNISGVDHYFISDYFNTAKKFEDNYYIHMSKNSYEFELICYQRWFVISEFIRQREYNTFWYLDSDVLVYSNLNDYLKSIPNYKKYDLIGFDSSTEEGDFFNPSFNFYTSKSFQGITDYLINSYVDNKVFMELANKWRIHTKENKPGGVCDMTQLKLFFLSKSLNVYNSYNSHNDIIPDGNININTNHGNGEKYKMIEGLKYTKIVDYNVLVYLEDGSTKKIISTHFQGAAKGVMKWYSKRNSTIEKMILYIKIHKIKKYCLALFKK